MPESQATQPETPAQEKSQSNSTPASPPQQVKKEAVATPDAQAKDRAKQNALREKVAKANPFSPENKAAKRAEFMAKLREERGVSPPKQGVVHESAHEQKRVDASNDGANRGNSESSGQSTDNAAHEKVVAPSKDASGESISHAQSEWYKREQAVRAAEDKVREANTASEKRRAEAEKAEASAQEAVKRMEWARKDPIAFLAETGMTQAEWSQFMANGGKISPEQEQMQAMRKQLAETQSRMEQMEARAKEEREAATRTVEESQFQAKLNEMTFLPQMGGIAAIRQRQQMLAKQTGTNVSLSDAAENLETEMRTGLERLLQNPKIRSSLKLDVNPSDAGQVAEKPRTLSNKVASESSSAAGKIHPLDWKAKRALFNERMAQERAKKIGR